MLIKYKGYVANQKRNNTVIISRDDVVEAEIPCEKRLHIKELRILINKHINPNGCKKVGGTEDGSK